MSKESFTVPESKRLCRARIKLSEPNFEYLRRFSENVDASNYNNIKQVIVNSNYEDCVDKISAL